MSQTRDHSDNHNDVTLQSLRADSSLRGSGLLLTGPDGKQILITEAAGMIPRRTGADGG